MKHAKTDVAEEKDEINYFEIPVFGSPCWKTVLKTKAIMRELDNYVPKLAIIQNDPENFTTNIYYTYTKFKLKIFN